MPKVLGGFAGVPALNRVFAEAGPPPVPGDAPRRPPPETAATPHVRGGRWEEPGRAPAGLDRIIGQYIPRIRQNVNNDSQLRNLLLSFWRDSERAEGEG